MNFADNLFSSYDLYFLKFFNQPFSVSLNLFFIFLIYSIYPFLAMLAFYFVRKKQNINFSRVALSVILGYLFVLGLKYYVNRPRPYETHPELVKIFEKTDPSFPSAHTFLSFLAVYFVPKEMARWSRYATFFYLLFLVPVSVMYAGVHYPSDVVFGAAIGLIMPLIFPPKFVKKAFKL